MAVQYHSRLSQNDWQIYGIIAQHVESACQNSISLITRLWQHIQEGGVWISTPHTCINRVSGPVTRGPPPCSWLALCLALSRCHARVCWIENRQPSEQASAEAAFCTFPRETCPGEPTSANVRMIGHAQRHAFCKHR